MTVYATHTLEMDRDLSGGYRGATDDISSDVIEVHWRRGKDYNSQLVGKFVSLQATILLKNTGGEYSSYVSSDVKPARRVRLQLTDGSGTVKSWHGFVQRINPQPSIHGLNVAEMTVIGPLGFINGDQIAVEMQASITPGAAAALVLDAAAWAKFYEDTILDDSPVGYWRFGESSGNAIDLSGNGNDGTVTGVTQGAAGLLGDDTDKAYSFDGASGDVDMGSAAVLDDIFSGGGSIQAWINASSDGENSVGTIFSKERWQLRTQNESGGTMDLRFIHNFSGTNGGWETTSAVITVTQAHHIAVTYNRDAVGNVPIIIVDGVAAGLTETSTPVGTASTDAAHNLIVGNRAADDRTFDGTIDEVALYNAILTETQVQKHHIAGVQQWRDLDPGQSTFTRWWTDQKLPFDALREIEDSELGSLWETREGKIALANRHARLDATHQTSQATFSDAPAAPLPYREIGQEDPLPFVFNEHEIPVQLYSVGSLAVLWTLSEVGSGIAQPIEPGETRTYIARFPTAASVSDGVAVDAWTTLVTTTDYTFNAQDDGGGSDATGDMALVLTKKAQKIEIAATNNGSVNAYPTFVQARGTPVTAGDPVGIRHVDTASQKTYGPRTFPFTPKFVPNTVEANDLARFVVAVSKDTVPLPRIGFLANRDATAMSAALRLDIGDRITIVGNSARTQLGLNEEVFIESEEHFIDREGTYSVAYQTSAAAPFSDFWSWGFSKWGTTTRWAG